MQKLDTIPNEEKASKISLPELLLVYSLNFSNLTNSTSKIYPISFQVSHNLLELC